MRINLQRAVEMRTLLDWAMAVVFYHAAPEDGLAFIVFAFQFEPRIVGIDGTAGEEVANFFRAHDYVHAHRIAAPQRRQHAVQRRRDGSGLSRRFWINFALRFFPNRK